VSVCSVEQNVKVSLSYIYQRLYFTHIEPFQVLASYLLYSPLYSQSILMNFIFGQNLGDFFFCPQYLSTVF